MTKIVHPWGVDNIYTGKRRATMHEKTIRRLDRAALNLLQALDEYGEELKPYLGPQNLETLHLEIVSLRRELLGLQMGILYQDWEAPPDLLESVVSQEAIPVEKAAAQVADLLSQRQPKNQKEEE